MAQEDLPLVSASRAGVVRARRRSRGWVIVALCAVGLFVVCQAATLWSEWQRLQAELSWARHTAVIGYENISPRVSFAQPPEKWVYHEGDSTYLWGCWDPRKGHQWFRFDRGDLDEAALSLPMGRDVFRAIDEPLIECGGGTIWGRIPDDAPVIGLDVAGVASVYPLVVLERVHIVNDLIDRRPFLVTYNPYAPPEGAVRVYEAMLEGRRVTMGMSGYYQAGAPLLYDRSTESLWQHRRGALCALAGPRKGQVLRQVAQPAPVAWDDWRGRNPGSRLLVGAGRPRGAPAIFPATGEER
jgi:hypothetical protein